MNKIGRIILFILTASFALSLFCSCNGKPGDNKKNDVRLYENGTTDYRIVFPGKPEDDEYNAFTALTEAFVRNGINIASGHDGDESCPESEYEIIVGNTSRNESAECREGLRACDYRIEFKGKKLVIVGGSPASTRAAVKKFIADYMPENTAALSVPSDLKISGTGGYDVNGISINGNEIDDYVILRPVNASRLEMYAAELLHDIISERVGVSLEIESDSGDIYEHEIRIGATARSGGKCEDYEYTIGADGDNVTINGGKHAVVRAVLDFVENNIPESSETHVAVTLGAPSGVVSTGNQPLPAEATVDGKNLVALCDQKNAKVVVIDLDAPDPTADSAIVWEWKPTAALGFTKEAQGYKYRVDEAVLRYSEPLGKYVVCVTSSSGYACVAEYPSGKCVWECVPGINPHSIEYLPGGNVAVCCAGVENVSGCIRIYTASVGANSTRYVSVDLDGAHGVIWDDENDLLWALGTSEIVAYRIGGTPSNPVINRAKYLGGKTSVISCHNLSSYPTDTDYLWISGSGVVLYSKSTGKFVNNYAGSSQVSVGGVKSVDSFADGRIIRAKASNVFAAHDTDTLFVTKFDSNGKATTVSYVFSNRAFYKARRFSAQYT